MAKKTVTPAKTARDFSFRDSADQNLFCVGLAEADVEIDEGTAAAPKREIVLTLLREGPGNARDKRWYERSCVEGIEPILYSRKKLFLNHLPAGAAPASDNMKDWAATLMSSWTVESDGMLVRKGRMKIHDDWLWERCQDPIARKELAVSIEGRGQGRKDTRNGDEYTCIESIYWLNAFKFVPYPGNATMGADTVEGAAAAAAQTTEEAQDMDPKLITLEVLESARPDLIEAIAAKVKAKIAAPVSVDVAALREEFKAQLDGRVKNLTATIDTLNTKLQEAEAKLDAAEVRARVASKATIIESCLKEADLPAEAVTPLFRKTLSAITEREVEVDGKKKTLTVEEQVREHIAERKALITPTLGSAKGSKGAKSAANLTEQFGELTESDKQFIFDHTMGFAAEEYQKVSLEEAFAAFKKAAQDKGQGTEKKAKKAKQADGEADDDEDDKK